jgi:hypothetical protein
MGDAQIPQTILDIKVSRLLLEHSIEIREISVHSLNP